MKAAELRNKTIEELQKEETAQLKELFKLNMQKGTEQLSQTHYFKQTRRNIARIKTIIKEKQGDS